MQAAQANYSAWRHRWRCVEATDCSLAAELAFTERLAQDNAKNYQLWNHRRYAASEPLGILPRMAMPAWSRTCWPPEGDASGRLLALALGPDCAERELRFTAAVLTEDEKNYHAWSHRRSAAPPGCLCMGRCALH